MTYLRLICVLALAFLSVSALAVQTHRASRLLQRTRFDAKAYSAFFGAVKSVTKPSTVLFDAAGKHLQEEDGKFDVSAVAKKSGVAFTIFFVNELTAKELGEGTKIAKDKKNILFAIVAEKFGAKLPNKPLPENLFVHLHRKDAKADSEPWTISKEPVDESDDKPTKKVDDSKSHAQVKHDPKDKATTKLLELDSTEQVKVKHLKVWTKRQFQPYIHFTEVFTGNPSTAKLKDYHTTYRQRGFAQCIFKGNAGYNGVMQWKGGVKPPNHVQIEQDLRDAFDDFMYHNTPAGAFVWP
jgi:hypothetical protein